MLSPTIGPVLTSWSSFFPNYELNELIIELLKKGTLNDLLDYYLKSYSFSNKLFNLMLIGDAGHPISLSNDRLYISHFKKVFGRTEPVNRFKHLSFLRSFISISEDIDVLKRNGPAWKHIKDLLHSREDLNTEIFDKLIDGIFFYGSVPSKQWMHISSVPKFIGNKVCFNCNESTNIYECSIYCRDERLRIIVSCPNCGIIEDYPKNCLDSNRLFDRQGLKVNIYNPENKLQYGKVIIEINSINRTVFKLDSASVMQYELPQLVKTVSPGVVTIGFCIFINNDFRIFRIIYKHEG
jgi:hypothetical protein